MVETCRNNHQFYPCYPHLDISIGLVHCQLRSCFKHISTKPLEDVNTLDCAWILTKTKRFDFPSHLRMATIAPAAMVLSKFPSSTRSKMLPAEPGGKGPCQLGNCGVLPMFKNGSWIKIGDTFKWPLQRQRMMNDQSSKRSCFETV